MNTFNNNEEFNEEFNDNSSKKDTFIGFKNLSIISNIPINTKQSQNKLNKKKKLENSPTKQNLKINNFIVSNNSKNELEVANNNLKNELDDFEDTIVLSCLDSGLKSLQLENYINKLSNKPIASHFIKQILLNLNESNSVKWCLLNEYGLAIKAILENNIKEQINTLNIIQNHCYKNNYPKIQVKDSQKYLIDLLFQLFFNQDIIDENSFYKWQDNLELDNFNKEISLSNKTALIQTTDFFMYLKTLDKEDSDDIIKEIPGFEKINNKLDNDDEN